MFRNRSLERIIEDQFREWELRSRQKDVLKQRPTVTISRLPGSGGRPYAEKLARSLGFDLFDREIVLRIAETAHLSEALVASLDERVRSRFTEWLMMLERERFLWPHQYLKHLVSVVGAIAQHGGAVILGRGSPFILAQGESLRVSLVAPLAVRAQRVAQEHHLDELEARRRVLQSEGERREFVKRSFNADLTDPTAYDLVFNTERLTVDEAVLATKAVFAARGFVPPEATPAVVT